jgi:hypothetical protein
MFVLFECVRLQVGTGQNRHETWSLAIAECSPWSARGATWSGIWAHDGLHVHNELEGEA